MSKLPLAADIRKDESDFPVVVVGFMFVSALALILGALTGIGDGLIAVLGWHPGAWEDHDYTAWTMGLFGHPFVHAGAVHFFLNMFFLWIFGPAMEDDVGDLRFAGVLFVTALAAAFTQWAMGGQDALIVGASGAVSGVMAMFLMRYPRVTVTFFSTRWLKMKRAFGRSRFDISMPAWQIILLVFSVDVILAVREVYTGNSAGYAEFGHLGGALAGVVLHFVFDKAGFSAHPVEMQRHSEPVELSYDGQEEEAVVKKAFTLPTQVVMAAGIIFIVFSLILMAMSMVFVI